MSRLALAAGLACSAALPISTQDPTKTLPESYQVQLDNDYVRVVRVHYDAGARLPEHTHPPGTTVYVYLNDSEGVTFSHSGNINRTVTRPPVKAGAVRIAAGPEEHHTAENPASTPSDFLRVWFKTGNGGERNLRRRLSPADDSFENKQLRISRHTAEPNQTVTIRTEPNQPALIVLLPSGTTWWAEAGGTKPLDVTHAPVQYLRIDLLTPPQR